MSRKLPPPNADLTQNTRKLAAACGVSVTLAYRWKKEAGIPKEPRARGVRKNSPSRLVSFEDWAKGCGHVSDLLGISHRDAWIARNKLIAEGHNIPKLPRGGAHVAAKDQSAPKIPASVPGDANASSPILLPLEQQGAA